jgi:hypothetical protein
VEFRAGAWWFLYLGGITFASYLFGSGRPYPLDQGSQLFLLSGFALLVFPLAVNSHLPQPSPHAMVELGGQKT